MNQQKEPKERATETHGGSEHKQTNLTEYALTLLVCMEFADNKSINSNAMATV